MAMFQTSPQASKVQVGTVDPYINERVTYVADLDEEAATPQLRKLCLCLMLPSLLICICFPFIWVILLVLYCIMNNSHKSIVRKSQVYTTEHTVVYVQGDLPIERSRVTIPLANIASVIVQPRETTINIKPTSPEVMFTQYQTTIATRSLPIRDIKNAEGFARAIREHIN